ncbi:MAG: hypothetical protein C4536_06940 [Actinobacteria bacterium]|nr:MAG: hypothetical protein C4536_06940 [Actinomycetota bacterium]
MSAPVLPKTRERVNAALELREPDLVPVMDMTMENETIYGAPSKKPLSIVGLRAGDTPGLDLRRLNEGC